MRKWIIDVIIFTALICGAASYNALRGNEEIDLTSADAQNSAGPESPSVLTRTFETSGISAKAALLQVQVSMDHAPTDNDLDIIKSGTDADIRTVNTEKGVRLYATLCVEPEAETIESARDSLVSTLAPWGPHTLTIAVTGVCRKSDFRTVQKRLEQNLYATQEGAPYEADGMSAKSVVSPLLMAKAQVAARQRDDDVLVYIGTPLIPMDF